MSSQERTPLETPRKSKQTTRKSPTLVAKNLAPVFETIFEKSSPEVTFFVIFLHDLIFRFQACIGENLPEIGTLSIGYHGRDVLDLGTNVEWNWDYRPSRNVYVDRDFFKFSETSGRYTVVRKIRDKNGRYYFFYPDENF
ncbi:uncharacterized protein LOC123012426 isoform X1 [Tribolium madens]|uniref:uncharacterized protein LOC123012426 isoform X1 n=1 Tax=Tribolium madens TaxID=41895 RepID=UPI001CF71DA1|nr:uncharacterized protein LOC123012426 isoform X1 [Tribolium madens]